MKLIPLLIIFSVCFNRFVEVDETCKSNSPYSSDNKSASSSIDNNSDVTVKKTVDFIDLKVVDPYKGELTLRVDINHALSEFVQ